MFGLTSIHRYLLYSPATGMRKGFDGLSGLVRDQLSDDPQGGDVFIFVNRGRGKIKLLHWTGSGYVLYYKRLETGRFHLPREEEIIEPQGLHREQAHKMGEEVTELLEYCPVKLYVRRIVRPKYLQVSNQLATSKEILTAALLSLPLPKGNAGPGLLAHLMVSKYVDHLPYYRQIQQYKREGIVLSKTTLNGWFTGLCDLFEPLYTFLTQQILSQHYLQADESPIKVIDRDSSKGTRQGYHWVYYAPLLRLAVFDYRKGRSREGPARFLESFQGTLQTDGNQAYNELGKARGWTLLACMAHARRYFDKALVAIGKQPPMLCPLSSVSMPSKGI